MITHPPLREALACSVLEAVQATRAMGRVMLSAPSRGRSMSGSVRSAMSCWRTAMSASPAAPMMR